MVLLVVKPLGEQMLVETFLDELKSRVSKLKAGPGLEQDSKIGPLINQQALEKVETQVQDALKKGAELISGGERIRDGSCANGFFYAPTILNRVTPEMLIYWEETFGPVAPVLIYQDEDDLLEMANDTHYGLASYVYTQNLKSAMRLFEGLDYGIVGIKVWINKGIILNKDPYASEKKQVEQGSVR